MGKGQKYLISNFSPRIIQAGISEQNNPNEAFLVDEFLSYKTGTHLRGTMNERVVIVTPGVKNFYDGPDIKNAVLFINGQYFTGDVECHLRESDWFAHSHDSDPRYGNVVLHILLYTPFKNNNLGIPSVVLSLDPKSKSQYLINKCSLESGKDYLSCVERLSDHVWKNKTSEFYKECRNQSPGIEFLLTRGFKIIGGKGNGDTMQRLAEKILDKYGNDLDPQKWSLYLRAKSSGESWNSKNVRPMKRMSWIIPQGEAFIRLYIEIALYSRSDEFDHASSLFDRYLAPVCGIGTQVELKGNVLLPFLASRAMILNQDRSAIELYKEWKKLALPYSYSHIKNQFRPYFSSRHLRFFHVLQGLIWTDQRYCIKNNCIVCPLKFES